MKFINYIYMALMPLVLIAGGCQAPSESTRLNVNQSEAPPSNQSVSGPKIEALPVSEGEGNYKLVSGDSLNVTVTAAAASEVEIFYQPVTAGDRALLLKTFHQPTAENTFKVELKIPQDFNGEVWGRVKYAEGGVRETAHLLLATPDEVASKANTDNGDPTPPPNVSSEASGTDKADADSDESARSDKFTGGQVRRGRLEPGNGNVRITVNVPAFKMTLWQGGKEIKSNYVGVGRKNFPIPVGTRSADKIILNPDWIPPDSEWVRRSSGIEPYERIPADDPDNPLGSIKIPLGQAYLLHEAQSASDLGSLVSHGCVRVMSEDLFEVTRMIARARNLSITDREIDAARGNKNRRVIELNEEVPVDINYDTMVVENGVLTIYPDVYERNANTSENLRAELRAFDVEVSNLGDEVLTQMLDKVDGEHKFSVAISEVKRGNALKGKREPLIPRQKNENG
jgi:lipoprotein-anchoring transpeptidase ErfK/SrfK